MTDRDPAHLHPEVRLLMEKHLRLAKVYIPRSELGETWRGDTDQNAAKQRGVSNAAWGQSWHNVEIPKRSVAGDIEVDNFGEEIWMPASFAYHIIIRDEDGRSIEGYGDNRLSEKDVEAYTFIGRLGEFLGLTWGGRWKSRDLVHFEWRAAPLSQVKAAIQAGRDIVDLRRA